MLITRKLHRSELPKLRAFYRENGYQPEITADDLCIVAEADGELRAALRLCREKGCLVLRGVRVAMEFQRVGIGSMLLRFALREIGDEVCYCIPYQYLQDFYGRSGFKRIPPESAPTFLRMRLARYREEDDLDVILMCRPAAEGEV